MTAFSIHTPRLTDIPWSGVLPTIYPAPCLTWQNTEGAVSSPTLSPLPFWWGAGRCSCPRRVLELSPFYSFCWNSPPFSGFREPLDWKTQWYFLQSSLSLFSGFAYLHRPGGSWCPGSSPSLWITGSYRREGVDLSSIAVEQILCGRTGLSS